MEPQFTVQLPGERKPSGPVSLSELLAANKDDADIVEWLRRAPVGGSLITGGGAVPVTSLRRIA